jgi:D-alanyl-D-alanine carboxypeptidase
MVKVQNALADVPLQAKAIFVYDETLNRKIYGRNDEVGLPMASLAKIMAVVIALNNHSADDTVSISPEAIKQDTDYGFFVNEKFNIKDLAEFTLIGSANDGAYALTENIDNFLEKMNDKAKKIGMENTSFLNSTGLDVDEKTAGAQASAQDVNVLAIFALQAYPEVFSSSVMPEINIKSLSGFDHNIKNTNTILDKIPDILFSKTGLTPLAGGNLTIIYQNKYGHNIAITVLGSTVDGRFSDMEKIVDTLYNMDYGN